ncbi:hypothetical protein K443DRAFT_149856 [Laccaria amethystina LaAM-08-1]|uniref:Uncharacterized protein n=1 Tax=Laccaria amethystina LaAM-08-1 TaxID=1095629 RepID=A0A0C9Y1F3_9AGAR|nr:hypothetical protein K443DRAFT_149856 [Laccaria amethystina LaAM-08-1]
MNPFQLLRGNLEAEPIHGRMICISSMPVFLVIENGTEGEHTVQVGHQRALSIRQLSVLPFFRRISSPADTRLRSVSHEDFCNRHTLKNPRPAILIPFLLHFRVGRYPRILSPFSDYLYVG